MFEFIAGVVVGAVFAPVWMMVFNSIKDMVVNKSLPK